MKLGLLVDSSESLRKLSEADELDIKTAFKIAENLSKIDEKLKLFEKSRGKLIEKYGQKDSEGHPIMNDGQYFIEPKNVDVFNEEYNKLRDVDADITMSKVKLNDLKDAKLAPKDIMALKFMIDAEEGEPDDSHH